MKLTFGAFIAFLSIFITSLASAQEPKPIDTLAESRMPVVLESAYMNNPALRAAREDLKAVGESLPQAVSGWLPDLTAQGRIQSTDLESKPAGSFYGEGEGSTEKNIGLNLSQPLYSGGATIAETRAAKNVIRSRISALIAQEQNTLQEVATAYMDVYRDRALIDLRQNNLNLLTQQHEATAKRFEVGELTRTDVQQAAARMAGAQASLVAARGGLKGSEARFRQLTGMIPGKLSLPDSVLHLPATMDEAQSWAQQDNPQIKSAIFARRAAEDDVDQAFSGLLPSISLTASMDRTYDPSPGLLDEQRASVIGVVATIPLYKSGSVRSQVRQAKHVANTRTLEIVDIRTSVEQEVVANWESLSAANAEIEARVAQVEASEIAREGVFAEEEFGSRTVLDTLDANQELLDAQVALIEAQRNKVVAEYALLAVVGGLSPEAMGFEERAYNYSGLLHYDPAKILNMHVDSVE